MLLAPLSFNNNYKMFVFSFLVNPEFKASHSSHQPFLSPCPSVIICLHFVPVVPFFNLFFEPLGAYHCIVAICSSSITLSGLQQLDGFSSLALDDDISVPLHTICGAVFPCLLFKTSNTHFFHTGATYSLPKSSSFFEQPGCFSGLTPIPVDIHLRACVHSLPLNFSTLIIYNLLYSGYLCLPWKVIYPPTTQLFLGTSRC